MAHFQPPAQSGPPRRASTSRRRISRRKPVHLQVPPHRVDDEERCPRCATPPGGCPSSQYSHGRARQARESGVDARACRPRSSARCSGVGLREHLARDAAEAEQARLAVLIQRHLAEQLGQLPGRQPPRQVHLEEAVLGVHEAGRPGQIGAGGGLDRRHAARVARDAAPAAASPAALTRPSSRGSEPRRHR